MKDLKYYENNCEEDYLHTPISVLRYITELEKQLLLHDVSQPRELLKVFIEWHNEKFSNYDELPEHIIDMFIKQNVSCSSYDVDKKCKRVLKYLFPDYETELNITRYENAMNALRSIAK